MGVPSFCTRACAESVGEKNGERKKQFFSKKRTSTQLFASSGNGERPPNLMSVSLYYIISCVVVHLAFT